MLLNNFNSPCAINSFSDYFALDKYSFVDNLVFESRRTVENTKKILS